MQCLLQQLPREDLEQVHVKCQAKEQIGARLTMSADCLALSTKTCCSCLDDIPAIMYARLDGRHWNDPPGLPPAGGQAYTLSAHPLPLSLRWARRERERETQREREIYYVHSASLAYEDGTMFMSEPSAARQ